MRDLIITVAIDWTLPIAVTWIGADISVGDIRHHGLTRRRPRRSGIRSFVFVEDKPPKVIS